MQEFSILFRVTFPWTHEYAVPQSFVWHLPPYPRIFTEFIIKPWTNDREKGNVAAIG